MRSNYLEEELDPPLSDRTPLEWKDYGRIKFLPLSEIPVGHSFWHAGIKWTRITPGKDGDNAVSSIMGMMRKTEIDPHRRVYVKKNQ